VHSWPKEIMESFAEANGERMQALDDDNPGAVFAYTDGSRREGASARCAGFYTICAGVRPQPRRRHLGFNILGEGSVPAGKFGCAYSAESGTILSCLRDVRDNAAAYFSGRRIRRLVLVTDARSSLESLRTTWLARVQWCEQETAHTLFELANLGIYVTLAFVFSHVGGAPGNEYVDKMAEKACDRHGHKQDPRGAWHVDTTRHALKTMHAEVDSGVAAESKWRFITMPADLNLAPSQRMPRTLSRSDEMLLFQARVGLLGAAGGMLHGQPGKCPFCLDGDAMSRGGASLRHLQRECAIIVGNLRPLDFCLWKQPIEAAARLRKLVDAIRETAVGAELRGQRRQ
jgi:hypothetical protein